MDEQATSRGVDVPSPDSWIRVRDGEEFFAQVNLLSAGYEEVERAVRAREWQNAFTEYRRVLFDRLGRLDLPPLDPRAGDPVAAADELLRNRISLLGSPLVDIGSPVDWLIAPDGDKQWQSHLGYFYFANCLIAAYRQTGTVRYLEKWMSVLNDFFAFHPLGVAGLEWSRAVPMYRNELAYGCGGEGKYPDYAGGSWIGLSCGRVQLWLSALATVGDDPRIPDAFLANLLTSIMRDHATVMFNNPRRGTPNQFFHVALVLTNLGVILREFNIAPACYLVGIERLETSMQTTALADGSDMEQSFNYNSGLPERFYELLRLYRGDPTPRVAALLDVVERRCRFLAAVTTPPGTFPSIAKTHGDDVRPMLAEWASLYGLSDVGTIAAGKGDGPGSAAFDYGGYYVLRSGIGPDDTYLLFKASRLAVGHMHEDCNSLVLYAHGRQLLCDSGNFNYADDAESRRRNTYFFSSASHNTVTVDGLGQGRLALQGTADLSELDHPIGARWYDSPTIGLVEGFYREGYTTPTSHPPIGQERRLPGEHRRTVVWVKPDVWVVFDELATEDESHRYTAHWQLAPGFTAGHIVTDPDLPLLRTADADGANLTIGCSRGVRPHIVYGSDDPYEGWCALHYNEAVPSADVSFPWNDGATTAVIHLLVAAKHPRPAVLDYALTPEAGLDARLADGRVIRARVSAGGDGQASLDVGEKHVRGRIVFSLSRPGTSAPVQQEEVVLDAGGKEERRDLHIRDGEERLIG